MLRVAASLIVVPLLLVALLTAAATASDGNLGSVTIETFELGLLPLVLFTALVLLIVFVPLLLVTSKFTRLTWWSTAFVGLLSALLPILAFTGSALADGGLRLSFRLQQLASHYPWLAMGAIGGLLFWVLAVFRNHKLDQLAHAKCKGGRRTGAA
jgi:hypothetical protein